MIKKIVIVVASLAILFLAAGAVLYLMNPTPAVPTISADEAAASTKPYVVKVHARWCAICMATKGVWSQIQEAYASQVHLLVLDVTNQETTDASRAEARRLGLEQFFDEYSGGTGTVLVLDRRTKAVTASIDGSRDFEEYRKAIDAALTGGTR